MNTKRAVFMAVVVLAIAALSVPLVSMRAAASGTATSAKAVSATTKAAATPAATQQQVVQEQAAQERQASSEAKGENGRISAETLRALGITRVKDPKEASARMKEKILSKKKGGGSGDVSIQSGEPSILNSRSALSAALLTTVGGRDNQFSEVTLIADWDGREDNSADRTQKVDDFSFAEPEIDQSLTRTAISEHTVANGFAQNVYYYGDSIGNVWVGVDTNPGIGVGTQVDQILQINLPTVINAFGTLLSDDQVQITGLAVNPVADLSSFARVNGSFAGFEGVTGEILYVSYMDTGGGGRVLATNQIIRSGLLAFPIADPISPAAAPPGILSPAGFPVTVGGGFGVEFSQFSNVAGCAVDDDGSVYIQLVDLIQFTGANITKIASQDT